MIKIKDIEKYIEDPLLDSIFREREEELYIECKNEDEDIIEIKQNYDMDCEIFFYILVSNKAING